MDNFKRHDSTTRWIFMMILCTHVCTNDVNDSNSTLTLVASGVCGSSLEQLLRATNVPRVPTTASKSFWCWNSITLQERRQWRMVLLELISRQRWGWLAWIVIRSWSRHHQLTAIDTWLIWYRGKTQMDGCWRIRRMADWIAQGPNNALNFDRQHCFLRCLNQKIIGHMLETMLWTRYHLQYRDISVT